MSISSLTKTTWTRLIDKHTHGATSPLPALPSLTTSPSPSSAYPLAPHPRPLSYATHPRRSPTCPTTSLKTPSGTQPRFTHHISQSYPHLNLNVSPTTSHLETPKTSTSTSITSVLPSATSILTTPPLIPSTAPTLSKNTAIPCSLPSISRYAPSPLTSTFRAPTHYPFGSSSAKGVWKKSIKSLVGPSTNAASTSASARTRQTLDHPDQRSS
mmetsp:Transcript_9379/g.28228  ORF Transcript_9379/g.28228 Transcript_9379/m.28228 type:complete len:213 (-) Transcript_9379:2058-2696(-)